MAADLKLVLEKFQEYITRRQSANIGCWNDRYAFETMENVVKPALVALTRTPSQPDAPGREELLAFIDKHSGGYNPSRLSLADAFLKEFTFAKGAPGREEIARATALIDDYDRHGSIDPMLAQNIRRALLKPAGNET